jgi:hypothetical protein
MVDRSLIGKLNEQIAIHQDILDSHSVCPRDFHYGAIKATQDAIDIIRAHTPQGDAEQRVADAIHVSHVAQEDETGKVSAVILAKAAIAAMGLQSDASNFTMGDASTRKDEECSATIAPLASGTPESTSPVIAGEIPGVDEDALHKELSEYLVSFLEANRLCGTKTSVGATLILHILRKHQALPNMAPQLESKPVMVSLMDCAMALQGNERIKLASDLRAIAKAVLDAAGVAYE